MYCVPLTLPAESFACRGCRLSGWIWFFAFILVRITSTIKPTFTYVIQSSDRKMLWKLNSGTKPAKLYKRAEKWMYSEQIRNWIISEVYGRKNFLEDITHLIEMCVWHHRAVAAYSLLLFIVSIEGQIFVCVSVCVFVFNVQLCLPVADVLLYQKKRRRRRIGWCQKNTQTTSVHKYSIGRKMD